MLLGDGRSLGGPGFWEFLERVSPSVGVGGAWLSMGNQQLAWTTIICWLIMDQALAAGVN